MWTWDPRIELHASGRILAEDAHRQECTAKDILSRFRDEPGLILADEVGMGKTFVALAVAVSALINDRERRPVVVMTPPSLKEKWPTDFEVFRQFCLPAELQPRVTFACAERTVDFIRLAGAKPTGPRRIIFLTHGAMSRALRDEWVMLAVLYQAVKGRRGAAGRRRTLARAIPELIGRKWLDRYPPEVWEELLCTPPRQWPAFLSKQGFIIDGDTHDGGIEGLLPDLVCDALPRLNTDEVYRRIGELPVRRSSGYSMRIDRIRPELLKEIRILWKEVLGGMGLQLPLLVLDEAHHAKNAGTRLASLFQSEEAREDGEMIRGGAFDGVFERMLFLTATPFQLGHHELCSILERFNAVCWTGASAPARGRDAYRESVDTLRNALNEAQCAAGSLDQAWGRLRRDDLRVSSEPYTDPEVWWRAASGASGLTPRAEHVRRVFDGAMVRMKAAERLLRRWIIRHQKPKTLSAPHQFTPRRLRITGEGILNDKAQSHGAGIPVARDSLLLFLLAARAAILASDTRPVFAEGLASSYEAYLDTRLQSRKRATAAAIEEDEFDESDAPDCVSGWYLDRLTALAPRDEPTGAPSHPKVRATLDRTIKLWESGEKVVIFCHYIATGRALRQHLSCAINEAIHSMGASKLKCPRSQVASRLERIGQRFFDVESPLRIACDQETRHILDQYPGLAAYEEQILGVVRRNLRTPAFLVRYMPLGEDLDARSLAGAMHDASRNGESLAEVLHRFCAFLAGRSEDEQARYVDALVKVQTGAHVGTEVTSLYSDDELQGSQPSALLPNVRLVNGSVRQETRQRLMLTFNTPFYPEVLIASSVLAEGVDLHLNCRHVIHHDLSWNPSMLEQRTGRLDRIGAKAESCGQPIHVYLPYVAGTQDEKMYRVVTDRERWFNVVMGDTFNLDALNTDRLSERIPLPADAAESLAFDLSVPPPLWSQK